MRLHMRIYEELIFCVCRKQDTEGASKRAMPAGLNESRPNLLHFHVCKYCGAATCREALEGRSLTSGILLCPSCGIEGPLNVEIREMPEPSDKK